jgi:hypothetical protein
MNQHAPPQYQEASRTNNTLQGGGRQRTDVRRMPVSALLQRKCACGGTSGPTGECENCRQKKLQRRPGNLSAPSAINHQLSTTSQVPPVVHEVLRSPGQPLDANTRAFMEPRFGHDFSHVRVHTDAKAAESARTVNALAYTVGQHVVFGAGVDALATTGGRKLVAHELMHTVQQQAVAGTPLSNFAIERSDSPAEAAANQAADTIMQGNQVFSPSPENAASAHSASLSGVNKIVTAHSLVPSALQPAGGTPRLQRQDGKASGKKETASGSLKSRVRDIDLKVKSKPRNTSAKFEPEKDSLTISPDADMTVEAGALISAPEDCRDISFGFIQLCRPYYLFRAVYQSLSGGDDLDVNPSDKIRARMPVLDVSSLGDIFYFKIPILCALPEPDKSMLARFSDRPTGAFKVSLSKDHYLAGVAWQAFFFTTLTVLKSGQPPEHLKSFYWDVKHCEAFGPPASAGTMGPSLKRTSVVGVGDFIDGAPSEPGIGKMGNPADKICKQAVNEEIQVSNSKPNKGKFNIGC